MTRTSRRSEHDGTNVPLEKLPKKQLPEFNNIILPGLSLISGGLVFAAMPSLIDASGAFDYFKCGLLAMSAGGVSYATNTLAIDRGARLAAIGSYGATLASTTAILTVGFGLFGATYAGLTLDDIDQLKLETYAEEQGVYIDTHVQNAHSAGRIGPVLGSLAASFSEAASCEKSSSCISRRGNGGEGRVYFALLGEAQKAQAVAGEVSQGEVELEDALNGLLSLQGAYQSQIADDTFSVSDKRIAASHLTAQIRQNVSALNEAAPVALAEAYAASLTAPISIPGRPAASQKLNQMRTAHGAELRSVIGSHKAETTSPPRFPGKAGVSDTFSYIGHFLPIAMIIGVVELVFPILLWLITFFSYRAKIARDENSLPPAVPARAARRKRNTMRGGRS